MKHLITLTLFLHAGFISAATVWSFGDPKHLGIFLLQAPLYRRNRPRLLGPNLPQRRHHPPRNSSPWRHLQPPPRNPIQPLRLTGGTLWAFANRNGNPAILSAHDYATLTFLPFTDAHGGANANNDGTLRNIIERDAVLYLVAEDIYLDIRFTDWSNRTTNAGAFGYVRAAPIPEPSTAFLLALSPLLMLRSRH